MVARIVVINNDPLMQKVFAMALENEAWELLVYSYAEIRVSSLSQIQANLIILDFMETSVEVAWGFLQMLKMDDSTAKIPVLITTVLDLLTSEIRGYLALQNIHVVYMPFMTGSFIKLIRQTLSLSSETGLIISQDKSLPILVVEDHEILRETLTELLRLEGYQVLVADNGLVALKHVYVDDHSLIFLDIQMPVMDGFEFLRIYGQQLRQHRPVIILSADATIHSHTFPDFVVGFLPKPYEIAALLSITAKYSQAI